MRGLIVIALALGAAGWCRAQGYVCAEGGGNAGKGAWADEVFGWMVEKGARGPVVIIGAVPLDQDERVGLFKRLGAESVSSLVVDASNAQTEAIAAAIAAAKVVFIRGGDQSRYVKHWKGTATSRAIIGVYERGGVVAGTSAGAAVLGEVVYDAAHGSLSADEVMADARHEDLTLATEFLGLVPHVLFDTHFTERARLARLPVMLAHAREDLHRERILGIGVDPRTAICIGPDRIAEVRGEGTATFLTLADNSRTDLQKGLSPTVTGISYLQLCAGSRYDLEARRVVARPDWARAAAPPAPLDPPTRTLSLDEHAGAFRIGAPRPDAWLTGAIEVLPGRAIFPSVSGFRASWADRPANAVAGGQCVAAEHPAQVVVWSSNESGVRLDPRNWLEVPTGPTVTRSILVLNARSAAFAGRGPAPRRVPFLEGCRLDLLGPGWALNLADGIVAPPAVPEPANPGEP